MELCPLLETVSLWPLLPQVRYRQRHIRIMDLFSSFKLFNMFTALCASVLFWKSSQNFYHSFSESSSYLYLPAIALALLGWLRLDFSLLSKHHWFENHLLLSSCHPKQPSCIFASLLHRLFQTSTESTVSFFGYISINSLRHWPAIQCFNIFTIQPYLLETTILLPKWRRHFCITEMPFDHVAFGFNFFSMWIFKKDTIWTFVRDVVLRGKKNWQALDC